jgi:2-octaprenyl-6-methoxyphenol hydroxylase
MADHLTDCVVVGTGPAGLVTALALAHESLTTRLIGPTPTSSDARTSALFAGSVELLRNLDVWPRLAGEAAPLSGLRLVDDTGGLLRAPETLFVAPELGLEAFGYNVDNAHLVEVLYARVRDTAHIEHMVDEVIGLEQAADRVILRLASGQRVEGAGVIAADGRNSRVRASSGIATSTWSYPQSAIATRFRHSRAHDGISTEFHRDCGPLTTVPLPGKASSLVWVDQPAEAARLLALAPDAFAHELERRLQGLLGTITDIGPRAVFPLSGLSVANMSGSRVALVGEAAHVLPPIGAQGLNLGFRDAATLAEELALAKAAGADPWSMATLAAYDRRRRADALARTVCVDLLNRSLISGFLPFHVMRATGLQLVAGIPWLRQLAMREGMQPSQPLPRLMQASAAPAEG